MSPLTRLTNIQLSLIHVNPLSDVPILDTLMSFAYVRRHASFPLASHLAVSSNAVRVGYAVVRFNRVRIELTFYHYSLKRTHNLGLESGLNFRWQYKGRFLRLDLFAILILFLSDFFYCLNPSAKPEQYPNTHHPPSPSSPHNLHAPQSHAKSHSTSGRESGSLMPSA